MPPPENFISENNDALEEAKRIIQLIESISSSFKIDDDIACLEDYKRRVDELETTINISRAEIMTLERQIAKKQQEIEGEFNRFLDFAKQYTQNEKALSLLKNFLSFRFKQSPTKERDIYKNTSIRKE